MLLFRIFYKNIWPSVLKAMETLLPSVLVRRLDGLQPVVEYAEILIEPKVKKTKKHRFQITGVEQKIVLAAYSENLGWGEILTAIKKRLSQPFAGNFMKNESIREYYCSTPRGIIDKRIIQIASP